jgi:hypothetical protein
MTNYYYTENLADFGMRELKIGGELLSADWPDQFNSEGVKLAFNKMSGNVFLVNDDYQVAMFNGGDVELFHSTPYMGFEGFITDLLDEYDPLEINQEDADYILLQADIELADLPENWAKFKAEVEEE